ncbi:MAG TPA: hypothetical protein VFA87_04330 [Rhizomicrobium sp.]|nr:hypothetical protein [Rhizomicrobium sp.]
MRTEFGYAWGKLYLAMLAMATSTAPLPQRVAEAFRTHLASLGRQNLPDFALERLTAMRARLSATPSDADDDLTIDPAALSAKEAAAIAEEIFSLYDEIARSDARDRVSGRS